MKSNILALVVLLASAAPAQTYRLRYPTAVDVLDGDGRVVGQRKLKAGTLLPAPEADEEKAAPKKAGHLTPSDLSPIMFKQTRPSAGAVFRAYLSLGDFYVDPFDRSRNKYWNVQVDARNADWYDGETFDAWPLKSSPLAKRLIALLQDGQRHPCLVKVRPIKNGSDYMVEILDFCETERDED